jgi:hypothetical protein
MRDFIGTTSKYAEWSGWTFRSLVQAGDAIITAPVVEKRSTRGDFRTVIARRSAKFDRVASLARLMASMSPALGDFIRRRIFRPARLPFLDSIKPLAYGWGSSVFRLQLPQGAFVLKVFKRSLGVPLPQVFEVASYYENNYRSAVNVYGWTTGLVVPQKVVIVHGPVLGAPVAAMLQPMIEGKTKDLFQDFTNEELVRLCHKDPGFRDQFVEFAQRTLKTSSLDDWSLDFLGYKNVVVMEQGQVCWLRIIDTGRVNSKLLKRPEMQAQLANGLKRLKSLLQAIEGTD